MSVKTVPTAYTVAVWGDLYLAETYTDITALLTTWDKTNGSALRTSVLGENWREMWIIWGFEVSHVVENESEIKALNCWVWTFMRTAEKKANFTTTMLEVNRQDVFAQILGADTEAVSGTPNEAIMWYAMEKDQIPFASFLFVSCVYTDSATGKFHRDIIAVAKGSLGSDFVEKYIKADDTLEWAEVTINGDLGGFYQKWVLSGDTESDVEVSVTTI